MNLTELLAKQQERALLAWKAQRDMAHHLEQARMNLEVSFRGLERGRTVVLLGLIASDLAAEFNIPAKDANAILNRWFLEFFEAEDRIRESRK